MPLYDLECDDCGTVSEAFQSMHAPQPTRCEACGRVSVRRIIVHFPAVHTDCSFYKGQKDGLPTNPHVRDIYLQNAKKIGIDPTGKRYEPELANKPCGLDPEAWVPEMEGRSHIKRVLKKRRWAGNGRVEVKAPSYEIPDEKKPYRPADDIIEGVVRRELQEAKATISRKEFESRKEKVAKDLSGVYG